MDTDRNFQAFSDKPNGKPLQPLHPVRSVEPDEMSGQTVDLAWVLAVARRRAMLISGVALTLIVSSGLWLVWNKRQSIPEYQGSFKLLVEPVTAEDRLRNQFLLSQNKSTDIQKIDVDRSGLLDYETQIRVLQSPQIMEPVIQQLQTKYPSIDHNSLKRNLSLVRLTYEKNAEELGTKILEVIYKDKNKEKIKFVLETIANAYLEYSLQERQKSLKQGIEFIETQLPNLQKQVDTLQSQLQTIRKQYNLIDPELADRLLSEQVLLIRRNRLDTEAQLAETQALYNTLQKQLNEANLTAVLATEDQAYETLLSKLQQLDAQIASDSVRFREDSPSMEVLRENQQNLRSLLSQESQAVLENLAGKIQGLEDRYQTIVQAENRVNQQLEQLPSVSRQIADLQRQLDVATDNLKEFLSKRETLKLDAAQQEIPWDLINPPELWRDEMGQLIPVESQALKRPFAIAVVLSVLLGIGVGFLVEILHTVFHTPEEIKGATRLPILGVIPLTKKLNRLSKKPKQLALVAQVANFTPEKNSPRWGSNNNRTERYTTSPFMEAFRSLYTNIRLLSSKKPIHSLAITSAIPGDGKTTVAVYLAKTAATIGQRVLLVDADLRCPQLHTRLDLPNTKGLTEIIATDITLNDAIQQSPLDDNFFILTTGQTFSDPIKLLSSDKMQYLMDQFSAHFDLVIYDTPPLLGLGDGNLLAAKADGTILVVGIEKTDRSLVMKAFDGLKIAGASILGIVANGLKTEATKSYTSYGRN
ncbi:MULTISPECIES: GumC family protein [unclassified Coleofasciculus]|uniref:GumC family protein n=1 Tax=unclassified Coleofasciculus TaxID=2692782 RepID=UPI0018800649|nr:MULTISPECIES: tyrosine-protein kinase family protein [unclassified Coleofasciculus]MBE9126904.1 polysaccharide biosynthesis tyrosine autokinase [Coleofasciculus sp. LEGE 07081]MBE9150200.1 polysaccharide biosynthesis tyrosine autokinase [Coleofasciculus sp. LEGE 07092]